MTTRPGQVIWADIFSDGNGNYLLPSFYEDLPEEEKKKYHLIVDEEEFLRFGETLILPT